MQIAKFSFPLCNITNSAVFCLLNKCIDGVKIATCIVLSIDILLYLTLVSLDV